VNVAVVVAQRHGFGPPAHKLRPFASLLNLNENLKLIFAFLNERLEWCAYSKPDPDIGWTECTVAVANHVTWRFVPGRSVSDLTCDPVPTKNSKSGAKYRALGFRIIVFPACSRSCVRSHLLLPAAPVAVWNWRFSPSVISYTLFVASDQARPRLFMIDRLLWLYRL